MTEPRTDRHDPLRDLLRHTAEACSLGARPPGAPLVAAGRSRRWAPLTAAAAVLLVAVASIAVTVHRGSSAPPAPTLAATARVVQQTARDSRDSDAGPPVSYDPPLPLDQLSACTADAVTATLDLDEGVLRLDHHERRRACALPAALGLDLPGVDVRELPQPDVPNPPRYDGRYLTTDGVTRNATWSGACTQLPAAGRLQGLDVPVAVTGTPPDCGPGAARLDLGPAHQAGKPGAVVPADRRALRVDVDLPEDPSPASVDYLVHLTNTGDRPVSLRPCPTYSYLVMLDPGGGSGDRGRLPCEQLPDTLAPHQRVDLQLTTQLFATTDPGPHQLTVTWSIAGTPPGTARATVRDRPVVELPDVPYLAPGADVPAPSSFRYLFSGAFPVALEGPRTVAAGSVLRYRAVLTNGSGRPDVPLQPCPAWTETLVLAPKASETPTPLVRRGAVDCARAPAVVRGGERIAFEMELTVPADTPAGSYQLFWQLHRGVDSDPFDLEVTG